LIIVIQYSFQYVAGGICHNVQPGLGVSQIKREFFLMLY